MAAAICFAEWTECLGHCALAIGKHQPADETAPAVQFLHGYSSAATQLWQHRQQASGTGVTVQHSPGAEAAGAAQAGRSTGQQRAARLEQEVLRLVSAAGVAFAGFGGDASKGMHKLLCTRPRLQITGRSLGESV